MASSSRGYETVYQETDNLSSNSRDFNFAPVYDNSRKGRRNGRDRSSSSSRIRSPNRNFSRDRSPAGSSRDYDDYIPRDYKDDGSDYMRGHSYQEEEEGDFDNFEYYDRDRRDRHDRRGNRRYNGDEEEYNEFYSDRARRRRHRGDDDDDRGHRRDGGDRYGRRSREEDRRSDNIQPRSPTIIAQNLSSSATEEKLEDAVKRAGYEPLSIAVIRDKNGDVKGYAFIEFRSIKDAEGWLAYTKRQIQIDNKPVHLNFSKPKYYEPNPGMDWNCGECNALNYWNRRRNFCIDCGKERQAQRTPSDERSSDSRQNVAATQPCNVLMIRGMDLGTTEETIRSVISSLTTKPVYDVRLIMDKTTGLSRGFCFVELGNTEDATDLLEKIEGNDPAFEIEGRRIAVGYARHGFNTPTPASKPKSGRGGLNAASNKPVVDKQYVANNAVAQAVAQQQPVPEFPQNVAAPYPGQGSKLPSTNPGAQPGTPMPQSTYTYDATSGYYYDASTGLYYDAASGYYYNSQTQQYLYWDESQGQYVVVNQDGTTGQTVSVNPAGQAIAQAQAASISVKKDVERDDPNLVNIKTKPKEARKIAKDMERWAKKMNTANEARKVAVQKAQEELQALEAHEEALRKKILEETMLVGALKEQVEKKESIRSMFVPDNDEEGSVLKFGAATSVLKPRAAATTQVVAEPDSDDEEVDDSKFIDLDKKACLLCKRQFPSQDVLMKHRDMSQLHKQNVERYKKGRSVK